MHCNRIFVAVDRDFDAARSRLVPVVDCPLYGPKPKVFVQDALIDGESLIGLSNVRRVICAGRRIREPRLPRSMSKPSAADDSADTSLESTDDQHRDDREPSRQRDDSDLDPSPETASDDRTLEDHLPSLAKSIRMAGFWGAIVLPVFYLPLLATGLSTPLQALFFLVLLAVNLAALYVGHAHRRR